MCLVPQDSCTLYIPAERYNIIQPIIIRNLFLQQTVPFGFYDELISFATCVSSFRNDDGTHLMLCIFYHCAPLTIYNVLVFFKNGLTIYSWERGNS
jgi:hypothetical protein